MKQKRIVIDASPLLYPRSGIGRLTSSLIDSIRSLASDYEILLFGRRLQGLGLSSIAGGLPSVHLRLPRAAEGLIKRAGLVEILCHGDIYHATDFYMPLKKNTPAVSTIHDVIFLKNPEKMVDHNRLAEMVPRFIRQCVRVITISEYSKKEISETLHLSPDIIDVTYPGVDRAVFSPPSDLSAARSRVSEALGLQRPYFLAVSCSAGRKNTPRLLEAYDRLLLQDPSNDLVVQWAPPQEIADKYSTGVFEKRIHFIGRQPDDILRDLYASATAVVFPSLYEGFGLPVIEAMSCGVPVITSNVTSMPEAGGDAAIYVDPHDSNSIASALEKFENGEYDLKLLRAEGLRQAAKFSWERCAKETIAVYKKCLDA
jgi:glycosyltransferase involved in cell wall biosynthesis